MQTHPINYFQVNERYIRGEIPNNIQLFNRIKCVGLPIRMYNMIFLSTGIVCSLKESFVHRFAYFNGATNNQTQIFITEVNEYTLR